MRCALSLLGGVAIATRMYGCAADDSSDAAFARDVIGDTTVFRSNAPLWPDTAQLVLQSTIGVVEGPEEYMFASIAAFAVDRAGAVFVADFATNDIRKFDASGEHVMTFGGEGSGPGELRGAQGIGILPGGRIAVRDSRLLRINVYDGAGNSIDHWSFTGHGAFGPGAALTVDSLGRVYTQITTSTDAAGSIARSMVQWTLSGVPSDTLPFPGRHADECPPETLTSTRQQLPVPETPVPVSAFSSRGYLMGCNGSYRFDHIQFDGTVRRFERAWTPVPISDAEREFWTEGVTTQFQRTEPGWRWNGPPVPDRKLAYRSLMAGDAGRIWVRSARPSVPRPRPERTPDSYPDTFYTEPVGFDVFAPDGRYLGPVNVPPEFRDRPTPVFRADTVWAVARDRASGVQRIGRFQLVNEASATN